jgi:hypothetical protein
MTEAEPASEMCVLIIFKLIDKEKCPRICTYRMVPALSP